MYVSAAILMTMTMFCSQTFALSSLDLCTTDNSSILSYYAKNLTAQKCGCEICLRKCCKPGYLYKRGSCYRNSSDIFKVNLYTEKNYFIKQITNVKYFQVGVPECSGVYRVNHSFIQTDCSVWIPDSEKIYDPSRYCIDEAGGYSLFLCFNDGNKKKKHYVTIATIDVVQTCNSNTTKREIEIVAGQCNGYLIKTLKDSGSTQYRTLSRIYDMAIRNTLYYLITNIFFLFGLRMIISMPFLLVTFLVYLVLPDTTIHKRALTFYVLSLLLAYICLVSVQSVNKAIEDPACHILGYSIIFFFIVSFCWLNVMCVDMWLAFSIRNLLDKKTQDKLSSTILNICAGKSSILLIIGLARFASSKTAETKRFLYYCSYAWGTPLCLVFIVLIMNQSTSQNTIYHPRLGYGKCFLGDGYPNLFYFYLPMAILITINVVLFALTALKIRRIKRETSVLKGNDSKRHAYEEDKQKFNLYLKLMLPMGVNWSMEVISWLVNWQAPSFPTAIWLLTDFANAAYGVFIFFIFVFKKKIWIQLKKRYYVCIGKPHKAQALSMTTTTRTSGFSTTESNLQSNVRLSYMRNGHSEERPLRAT